MEDGNRLQIDVNRTSYILEDVDEYAFGTNRRLYPEEIDVSSGDCW